MNYPYEIINRMLVIEIDGKFYGIDYCPTSFSLGKKVKSVTIDGREFPFPMPYPFPDNDFEKKAGRPLEGLIGSDILQKAGGIHYNLKENTAYFGSAEAAGNGK